MVGSTESLKMIEFVGQSQMPLYVDDIQVSRDATAFVDQDRDGLPDGWERINQLALEQNDRDADPDADGLSNVRGVGSRDLARHGRYGWRWPV